MDKEIFVQNVRKYCSLRGVKPTVACRESGAGRSLLTNLEQNGSLPSVEKVQKLATYLGVTTSELLGEKIDPTLVVVRGLNKDQQELVRLYNGAPSELRHAALKILRSTARPSTGVNDGWGTVQIEDSSIKPVKVLGAEPVAVEAVAVAGKVKKMPYGRVAARPKKKATSRGRGRGGPARGR